MSGNSSKYSRYFIYIKPITKIPIIRTYGTTIFTLIVMAIFIIFAIKPTVETILVLQKKLEDSNQILKKVNQKAENLSKGKENYENMDPNIKAKINAAIPDTAHIKSITQIFEQSAQKYVASVSALQFEPFVIEVEDENRPGNLSEMLFTFNVEGQYPNLLSILQDLKSSGRLIYIDSMFLSRPTEGGGLIMSISGKTYFIK